MPVVTYEAVVENGRVRLAPGVALPDHAKVFVVVPDQTEAAIPRVWSPRLVDPQAGAAFRMEVRDEPFGPLDLCARSHLGA